MQFFVIAILAAIGGSAVARPGNIEIERQQIIKLPEQTARSPTTDTQRILNEIQKINIALGYVKQEPRIQPRVSNIEGYFYPKPSHHPIHSKYQQNSQSARHSDPNRSKEVVVKHVEYSPETQTTKTYFYPAVYAHPERQHQPKSLRAIKAHFPLHKYHVVLVPRQLVHEPNQYLVPPSPKGSSMKSYAPQYSEYMINTGNRQNKAMYYENNIAMIDSVKKIVNGINLTNNIKSDQIQKVYAENKQKELQVKYEHTTVTGLPTTANNQLTTLYGAPSTLNPVGNGYGSTSNIMPSTASVTPTTINGFPSTPSTVYGIQTSTDSSKLPESTTTKMMMSTDSNSHSTSKNPILTLDKIPSSSEKTFSVDGSESATEPAVIVVSNAFDGGIFNKSAHLSNLKDKESKVSKSVLQQIFRRTTTEKPDESEAAPEAKNPFSGILRRPDEQAMEAIKSGGCNTIIHRLRVRKGGIAIAGPGGVATAGSGGTAIVGPGGLALTHPRSITIAGPDAKVYAVPETTDLRQLALKSSARQMPSEGVLVATGPVVYYS